MIQEQRAQMVENSRLSTLGEMASGGAHEINNPMTFILGKVTILKRRAVTENLSESVIHDLERIEIMADRVVKIIRGLKLFSRNASNDLFEAFNLNSVIESTLDLCRERIIKLNIKLTVSTDNGLECFKLATQISQSCLT